MTARPQSRIPGRVRELVSLAIVFLWLAVLPPLPALADETSPALKGVALVIGQSKYQHLPTLTNTANDTREITRLLTALGFETRSTADRDAVKLRRDLERFAEDAEGADAAVLYYSGHGIEAGGENYLLPVDADLSALADAGDRLVPLAKTVERIRQSVPVTIFLIDACRTSPFHPAASSQLKRRSRAPRSAPPDLVRPKAQSPSRMRPRRTRSASSSAMRPSPVGRRSTAKEAKPAPMLRLWSGTFPR